GNPSELSNEKSCAGADSRRIVYFEHQRPGLPAGAEPAISRELSCDSPERADRCGQGAYYVFTVNGCRAEEFFPCVTRRIAILLAGTRADFSLGPAGKAATQRNL